MATGISTDARPRLRASSKSVMWTAAEPARTGQDDFMKILLRLQIKRSCCKSALACARAYLFKTDARSAISAAFAEAGLKMRKSWAP